MTRINTNVSSFVAQKTLARSNADLQTALTRLSTGLRINVGKDDPAGLIASENLRRDITSIQKAVSNTERASQLIATADSALGQVSSLLNDVRGLVTEAANSGALSSEQIAANQLQVDASLEAINRIAAITTFQGRKILDGSLDFITTAGAGFANIADLTINQANLHTSTGTVAVTIDVTTEATQATVTGPGGPLAGDAVVQIAGNKGSEVFNFAAGTTLAQIRDAVNLLSDSTGVEAAIVGADVVFNSVGYGTDQFVDVQAISGTFTGSGTRNVGTDIVANVNGTSAQGKGNNLTLHTATLDLSVSVVAAVGAPYTANFTITGGGALFQLGPDVVGNQQARIGITSLNTAQLGGVNGRLFELRSGGTKALDTDASGAASVVDEVISKVTQLRGRLGAFQRTTLDTNIASLNDTVANLTEAESSIRDADFATETAKLTRAQILVQSGTAVLQIANQNPQNVLALLR